MIGVKKFEVVRDFSFPGENLISWEISSEDEEDLESATIILYRNYSGNFDDPKTRAILEQPADESNECMDENSYTLKYINVPQCYYWLKVIAPNPDVPEESIETLVGPVHIMYSTEDYIHRSIVFNERFYLRKILKAQPMAILKKRTFGRKCKKCYDYFNRKALISNCNICYGTGFRGGFFYPVVTRVQMNSPTFAERFDQQGPVNIDNVVQGWLTNYPVIHPNDILIDREGNRYIIIQVYPSRFQNRFITRQIVNMQRVPYKDLIFSYELPENIFEGF